MILTALPDLPPRPETTANAEFRRRFYARWGRENAIVCGRAAHAEYALHPQTLSLKMAGEGRERYLVAGRREVAVDADNILVLNEGSHYGSLLRAETAGRPAWTFSVFFRPGLQDEVAGARALGLDAALEVPRAPKRTARFAEHLRPHGDRLSTRLRHIASAVRDGERDETWLEEQCLALAHLLLDAEGARDAASAAHTARAAQRAELQRRLRRAADHIETHFDEPLTIADLAGVACLSRYHFVREFGHAFGLSPHGWLTRKRARAARRLLQAGETDREAIALRCGFGSRWSLARALASHAVADEEGQSPD